MATPPTSLHIYADMMLLLVKTETTAGTDAVPTPALNALYCAESSVTPTVEMVDLERYGHTFRSPGAAVGKSFMDMNIKVPLVGGWAHPTYFSVPVPDWDPLMTASGFERTDTSATPYTLAIISETSQPFSLVDLETVDLKVDALATDTATINTASYADITAATAAEVAADLNPDWAGFATMIAYKGFMIIVHDAPIITSLLEVESTGTSTGIKTAFGAAVDVSNAAIQRVTSRAYTPKSLSTPSTVTCYCYMFPPGADENSNNETFEIKSFGAVFDVEMNFDANGESFLTFTGKGSYGSIADKDATTALITAGNVNFKNRDDSLVAIGGTITFDDRTGADPRCDPFSQMSFKTNWEVTERTDQCHARGIRAFFITRKGSMTGSVNPEAVMNRLVPPAAGGDDGFDRWANVFATTRNRLSALYVSPKGSNVLVVVENLQYGSPGFTQDGSVKYEQEFYCRDDSDDGDDYISVTLSCTV